MKQRYKNRVAWLYKKSAYIKDATKDYSDTGMYDTDGMPFYCNVIEKARRVEVPMSNTYRTVTETIIKTDAQLNFEEHDRITFVENPVNDVNTEDFSLIVSAVKRPRFEKGSKYRTNDIYEWEIRIS